MKTYMVCYDLNKPGQNYEALFKRLIELGFTRVMYSQWVARAGSNWTAVVLRDDLARFVDANDTLFVTQLVESAWRGLKLTSDATMQQLLA